MNVFEEPGDAGNSIAEAAGVVTIPEFEKIEGSLPDTADVDFYELELESDVEVKVELSEITGVGTAENLTLFDAEENVVATSDASSLEFSGDVGETFFLQVGMGGEIGLSVFTEYEISLKTTANDSDELADDFESIFEDFVAGEVTRDAFSDRIQREIVSKFDSSNLDSFTGEDFDLTRYFALDESQIDTERELFSNRISEFVTTSWEDEDLSQSPDFISRSSLPTEVSDFSDLQDLVIQDFDNFSSLLDSDFIS